MKNLLLLEEERSDFDKVIFVQPLIIKIMYRKENVSGRSFDLNNINRVNKANDLFTFYNAEHKKLHFFGDWAVNECGDIINYIKGYPLYNYCLIPSNQNEKQALTYWTHHIGEKYDHDVEHFVEAFKYALSVLNNQVQSETH